MFFMSGLRSMRSYQTSSEGIVAYSAICFRYDRTAARTALARSLELEPAERPATSILVVSRLRSHSHGAGSVSSKSLISKIRLRSGVANPPKFMMWQSPHACTRSRVVGVCAKSKAIIAAAPRRKVKGDLLIRAYRIGSSFAIRPLSESIRRWIGSGLFEGGFQTA